MKAIAIVGSPRKGGNTEVFAGHALKAIAEEGIDTELVSLAGVDIRPCNACMAEGMRTAWNFGKNVAFLLNKLKS